MRRPRDVQPRDGRPRDGRPAVRRLSIRRALVVCALLSAGGAAGAAQEAREVPAPDLETLVHDAAVLIDQGKVDESIAMLQGALDRARETGAPDRDRGLLHARLAIGYFYRRNLDQVDRQADLAIALLEDDPEALSGYADALSAKCLYLGETGRIEPYMKVSLEELAVRRKLPPADSQLASPLINLALAHADTGDYRAAERYLLEALEYSQRYEADTRRLGMIQTNLAYVYGLRKEYRSAAEMAQKAVDEARRIAPDSVILALRLENLGAMQQALGEHELARPVLEEALAIQRRRIPGSVDEARSLGSLAQVDESAGRTADAEARLRAAVAIMDRQMPGTVQAIVPARDLARLLIGEGELDEAQALLERAVEVTGRAMPNSGEHAESLHAMGLLQRARGDADAAVETMSAAVDALEVQYDLLGGTVLTVASFSSAFEPLYKDLSRLLIARGDYEAAIALLERYRERALLDRMEINRLLRRSAPGEQLASGIEELRRKARELDDAAGEPEGDGAREDRLLQLAELRRRRRELLAEAVRADARLAGLLPGANEAGAVASELRPDQRILYFNLGDEGSDLLVVSAAGVRAYRLPARAAIDALVRRYRLLLQTPRSDLETVHRLGRELYDALLAPAGDALPGAGEYIVAAEGSLLLLPFATLRDPQGRYLVESVRLRQVGSLAGLAAAGRVAEAPARAGYTGFAFESDDDVVALMTQRNVGRLKFVVREVERAAGTFAPQAVVYTGAAATEATAKRVERTAVLHFATHAVVDSVEPMRSFIELADDDRDDGRLELWEVMEEMQLDAGLVVLSACDTAVGPVFAGEGVLGLSKGFAFAGADAVLASLWPVADASTSRLIEAFFHHLAAGENTAEALRRAQLAVLAGESPGDGVLARWLRSLLGGETTSHPYYWAPFILSGGG